MGSSTRPGAAALADVTLYRATLSDLPEVVTLERDCYADPWPASAFATLPINEQVFFRIARARSGQLAGYVVGWYVMDEGELANLAVAPQARGHGVGRMLLEAMVADTVSRGIRQLYLEVRESNHAARRLYEANGFEEVGRRKQYYRMPSEDALILRRRFKQ